MLFTFNDDFVFNVLTNLRSKYDLDDNEFNIYYASLSYLTLSYGLAIMTSPSVVDHIISSTRTSGILRMLPDDAAVSVITKTFASNYDLGMEIVTLAYNEHMSR